MSSNRSGGSSVLSTPISEFHYRPTPAVAPKPVEAAAEEAPRDHELRVTEEALRKSLAAERAAGVAETEARLRPEYEQRHEAEKLRVSKALEHFEYTRKDYFAKVEVEVVQLALSIAAKILHRESQVDPMLVGALVQIALGQLKEGAAASLRVRPDEVRRWQAHFSTESLAASVNIVGDVELLPKDCILETELGSVNFNLDVQLKEVEKGFFDVLAQRPVS
jgi:flagellar assembly protein FliH